MITSLTPQRSPDTPGDGDWLWFWEIVDPSVTPDESEQLAKLKAALEALSDQDVVDFVALYRGIHAGLEQMRLWAAAYLINGGCSDDGFIDFRAWLISRGRRITEKAMADPDSLAELGVEMDTAFFEGFGYAATDVFRMRSRGLFPKFESPRMAVEPEAGDWTFDFDDGDEMRRRLPRLAALYLP